MQLFSFCILESTTKKIKCFLKTFQIWLLIIDKKRKNALFNVIIYNLYSNVAYFYYIFFSWTTNFKPQIPEFFKPECSASGGFDWNAGFSHSVRSSCWGFNSCVWSRLWFLSTSQTGYTFSAQRKKLNFHPETQIVVKDSSQLRSAVQWRCWRLQRFFPYRSYRPCDQWAGSGVTPQQNVSSSVSEVKLLKLN